METRLQTTLCSCNSHMYHNGQFLSIIQKASDFSFGSSRYVDILQVTNQPLLSSIFILRDNDC